MFSEKEERIIKALTVSELHTNDMIRQFGHRFSAYKHSINQKIPDLIKTRQAEGTNKHYSLDDDTRLLLHNFYRERKAQ